MGRRAGNAAALILGLAVTLALAEAGVRLFWRDAPTAPGGGASLPILQVRDPRVLYRLVPNSTGIWNGTHVRVNSLGLRGPDHPVPRVGEGRRVLLLGDSMIFGAGLPEEETISARLENLMPEAEVINAGVFGYNMVQQIALLEEIAPTYRPDVVIAGFVHNDIDNWGLGDGGAVPPIMSSRFDPPPRDAWSSRLADFMLPGTFDPDRLNLLPAEGGGVRTWIAARSRLYLFVYVRLRTHAWNLTAGERRDPFLIYPVCRTAEVVWDPLRDGFRRMRAIAASIGARFGVVILGAQLWEGRPLERLAGLLEEEGIPVLDLTPVWVDPAHYAREYTLGWDPHPNGRATRLVADLLRDFLAAPWSAGQAGPPGRHDILIMREDLRAAVEAWEARQADRVAKDDAGWRVLASRFGPSPVPVRREEDRTQILYGFWPGDDTPAPPLAGPDPVAGAVWMTRSGGLLLSGDPTARSVRIEARVPALPGRAGSVAVALSAPPDRCDAAYAQHGITPDATGRFVLDLDLPEDLAGAPILEVTLRADRSTGAVPAATPGVAGDPRRISILLERVALHGSAAAPARMLFQHGDETPVRRGFHDTGD